MPDDSKNSSLVPIIVAIIAALATIISAYIAHDKSNKAESYQRQNIETRGDFQQLSRQYDSLVIAHNSLRQNYALLVANCQNVSKVTRPDTTKVLPEVLPIEGSEGEHYVKIESALGDVRNRTVTVNFKVTNEIGNGYGYLYLTESKALFNGKVFNALRGQLGDMRIGGSTTSNYPPMHMPKGEPIDASLIYGGINSNITEFSHLTIRLGRDEVPLHHVPIQWQ